MTLQTGARLGAYEIRGALGAGGMGEVYRAWDEVRIGPALLVFCAPEAGSTRSRR